MILLELGESISDITIDISVKTFDLFYHPSQMHLLVIGNFDVDEVLQVVKKYDLILLVLLWS